METKICSKCKELKNSCEFSFSKRNKNGLRGECKECQKKYYSKNSEKLKSREEFNKLCHYTNLQPLWASENLSKGKKLIHFETIGGQNVPMVTNVD
jgi:hypothetical protein